MEDTQITFSEYMDNSKRLFKLLFGKVLYNKLNTTKIKSIEWNGVDIDCCNITATFPNVKERFNKDWIEYFSERKITILDLYLQTVFHYGYQQSYDYNKPQRDMLNKIISELT